VRIPLPGKDEMNAKVVSNEKIGESLYRMKLDAGKKMSAKPGQFVNVLVSDSYQPLLRRPFSIYDADGKSLSIVYKVIGDATKILSRKKPGDILDIIGPLGNTYPEPQKGKQKQDLILIGGGTGAASIYFLAKTLKKKKVKFTLIQGARNKQQIVAPAEFKKLGCEFSTDDGSLGKKGFVSDLLQAMLKENTVIYTCGPKPMFKAIEAAADKKKNVKVFASFEEYMGCGIGACLSCVIEFKRGDYSEYKRVCKDGTVFNLEDVIF
jgi:dihydroorotate dehydrogenase electron transfer subunit